MENGFLVLKRRLNQEVVIRLGDVQVVVKPIELSYTATRLAFQASSPEVLIDRREIFERKKKERGAA